MEQNSSDPKVKPIFTIILQMYVFLIPLSRKFTNILMLRGICQQGQT